MWSLIFACAPPEAPVPDPTVSYFAYRDDLAKPGGCAVAPVRAAEVMGYELGFVAAGMTLLPIRGDGVVEGLLYELPASCVDAARGGEGYTKGDFVLEPAAGGEPVKVTAWVSQGMEAAPEASRAEALLAARRAAGIDVFQVLSAVPASVTLGGRDGALHAMLSDPASVDVTVSITPTGTTPSLRSVSLFGQDVPREPDGVWADGTPVSRSMTVGEGPIYSLLWLLDHDAHLDGAVWWVSPAVGSPGAAPAGAGTAMPADPPAPSIRVTVHVAKGDWHHQLGFFPPWTEAGRTSLERLANSAGADGGEALRALAAQVGGP